MYQIVLAPELIKELISLKKGGFQNQIDRFFEQAMELAKNPLHGRPGLDIKELKGARKGAYRLRIGVFRVMYQIDRENKMLWFTHLFHRGKAYR